MYVRGVGRNLKQSDLTLTEERLTEREDHTDRCMREILEDLRELG